MSESLRSKSSVKLSARHAFSSSTSKSLASGSASGSSSTCGSTGSAASHKFSNIVNKVESLICKMSNEKVNNFKLLQESNTARHIANATRRDICCCMTTHKNEYNKTENDMILPCEKCNQERQRFSVKLKKTASLDSLNNLTDADDSVEDNPEMMYTTDTDEDNEVAHITGTTNVQVHRRCDLDQLTDETIRVFNEQCTSLENQNMDFENAWSTEEDDHQKFCNDINCSRVMDIKNDDNEKNRSLRSNYETHFRNFDDKKTYTNDSGSNNNNNNNTNNENCYNEIKQKSGSISPTNSINNSPLNSTLNNNNKPRRLSVASSGSVGRMETIVEEPTENKISVKEILARFETLSTNETQSKASTLSSGARAAAQTLNVPLERLESRQSNQRESPIAHQNHSNGINSNHHINNANHGRGSPMQTPNQENSGMREHRNTTHQRSHHDSMIIEHNQQQQTQQHQRHSQQQNHHMRHGGDNEEFIGETESHMLESHPDHTDRAQHHYVKQASYLHSNRKVSNGNVQHYQQQHQQHHQPLQHHGHLDSRDHMTSPPPTHHLESNYTTDDPNAVNTPPSVTKYSLLQFAMQHFRNDQVPESRSNAHETSGDRSDRRTLSNRLYAELVKWQGTPIRMPLLRLPNDLAPLALECFDCILRYCGDVPPDPELTEVKCVYTVLMHCHKYLALRDEVYCQLMKQTTANRSPCPDSSQRAWRLLSILAAYFGCSEALRPYLMEHLTSAASDRRRSCHGTASVCLTNLRKTARCGGRKNVPSVEEVTAVSAGRSARRQIYRLPGGAERVVNTRCSTVVGDVIGELCALLGIDSEVEQQEFSLYCIVQGDAFTMPLAADEYILDVTTELLKSGQPFYLIFCRSVWHFPLKRDPAPTPLYIEVLFNQVAPDYLEGLLLELPGGNGIPIPEVVRDMARIAAMLHRAADLTHVPAMKEIKFLLPKPALGIRELRPAQWVGLVQSAWPQIANLSPGQVKAQFLNVLSAWPLFGSSFFAVKRIWTEDGPHVEESNPLWRDLILALNRRGVLFLDPNTHETLQHWPFMEVISTRKVRSEDGALFLDMKVGNLMQQRVIRVQTEQAHEISRLVRQYITMAQISQRDKRELN